MGAVIDHIGYGVAAYHSGRYDLALDRFMTAVHTEPTSTDALINAASASGRLCRFEDAVTLYQRALDIDPANETALYGIQSAYAGCGDYSACEAACRHAVTICPTSPRCHVALGFCLLAQGKWEGWAEAEWRLRKWPEYQALKGNAGEWDGRPLPTHSLLAISCEQGMGDAVHFARYMPWIRAAASTPVILICHGALVPFFRYNQLADITIPDNADMPVFEAYRALMSSPMVFGTTEETIPREVPYLRAPAYTHGPITNRRAIGLCWAGNRNYGLDHLRSFHGYDYAPLESVPATFYSLQVGHREDECPPWVTRLPITSVLDTAGLVAALDTVITSDTFIAHLAGAMGIRTHLLLNYIGDWRWMRDRHDSPWYPTMTLHRKSRRETWIELVERLKVEL